MAARNPVATLLMLIGSLVSAGCHAPQRFEYTAIIMGVEARVVLYAPDEPGAQRAARAAFDRMQELDSVMSDWRPDSELMRACAEASTGRAVPISPDLCRVLLQAQQVSAATGGAFDVTVGPVVALWRQSRRNGRLPEEGARRAALARVGWQDLHVDPESCTMRLARPDMQLDLGGIGKGFAADEAVALLAARGFSRCLVALGGDIAAGDPPPQRPAWQVATTTAPSALLLLSNGGVSTSGDTEQFVEIEGARYSHIVDPHSGLGLTSRIEVTVVAPDATTADALATAISVLGAQRGLETLKSFPGCAALVETRGPQGPRRLLSPGFP